MRNDDEPHPSPAVILLHHLWNITNFDLLSVLRNIRNSLPYNVKKYMFEGGVQRTQTRIYQQRLSKEEADWYFSDEVNALEDENWAWDRSIALALLNMVRNGNTLVGYGSTYVLDVTEFKEFSEFVNKRTNYNPERYVIDSPIIHHATSFNVGAVTNIPQWPPSSENTINNEEINSSHIDWNARLTV